MKILFDDDREQAELVGLLESFLKLTGNDLSCRIHDGKDCPKDCTTKKMEDLIDLLKCRRCSECQGDDHHWIDVFELPGIIGCKHCPALADAKMFDFDLSDNDE